ncbi:malonic semialdehyde reductase [Pseudaestuariivita sp.]|uniref:malonic semialdehyde reductase n=1 Tax=Pseudaestuariivita sp. TaxID=2211669 RepID=UPI004059CCC1
MTETMEGLRRKAQEAVTSLRGRIEALGADEIALILSEARSHYAWTDKQVPDALLREVYDLTRMGPTSMNSCPARFLFVRSEEGKARLAKSLKSANVLKVLGAPVTAIIAYDLAFWEKLPQLFPHEDRRPMFEGKAQHIETTAFRNSTLQGAYFMVAARALGLDVGAISGFDNAVVDAEFFDGTPLKSNFLCNVGYADESALFQRLPRFEFGDVCEIV